MIRCEETLQFSLHLLAVPPPGVSELCFWMGVLNCGRFSGSPRRSTRSTARSSEGPRLEGKPRSAAQMQILCVRRRGELGVGCVCVCVMGHESVTTKDYSRTRTH